MNVLIGALSAQRYTNRRDQCRKTWMLAVEPAGLDAVFLLGVDNTKPERHGDELWLPCPDAYETLSLRTQWFCRWALTCDYRWDYLFKADDDTFIHIPRLLKCAEELKHEGVEYAGAEWKPGVEYGSGGAGYFLSRLAAQIVAETVLPVVVSEDLVVGEALHTAGIALKREPRLIPFGGMEDGKRPTPRNNIITTHGIGRNVFEACWRET